jgi:hypothetical protein
MSEGKDMTEEQKTKLRQKWGEWLEIIGNELSWLLTGRDFFYGIRKIVESNKKIQSPSALHNWISDNYVAKVTTGIISLTDRHRGTISLYWLIKGISKNREVITRDYYVSEYRDKCLVEIGVADRDFDKFAKRGEQLIRIDKLNNDIKLLDEKTCLIKTFRDQWIAHFDEKRKIKQMPTFGDVDKALDTIDSIFCDYTLLLKRYSPPTRKPVLQYDWREPLRYPWIEITKEEKEVNNDY